VPGRPDLPPPHVGRPVKDCICILCQRHRTLDRQARRDALDAAAFAVVMVGPMTVRAAENATQALKDALGVR